jgi:hypothetical protein
VTTIRAIIPTVRGLAGVVHELLDVGGGAGERGVECYLAISRSRASACCVAVQAMRRARSTMHRECDIAYRPQNARSSVGSSHQFVDGEARRGGTQTAGEAMELCAGRAPGVTRVPRGREISPVIW